MFLSFIVLLIVSILFIVEVGLGSSSCVYDCELGKASEVRNITRLSLKEFFSKMLPLLLLALGAPLLFLYQFLGWGLLLLAALSWASSFLGKSPAKP